MKRISRNAEYIGYNEINGEIFEEWRCPSCGYAVEEQYVCCPYCGQKIEFPEEPLKIDIMIKFQMSMSEVLEIIGQEAIQDRKQEKELLEQIAKLTSPEFAQQAAEELGINKNSYSFDVYLWLLRRLHKMVLVGIPNCAALALTQTGLEPEEIIKLFNQ